MVLHEFSDSSHLSIVCCCHLTLLRSQRLANIFNYRNVYPHYNYFMLLFIMFQFSGRQWTRNKNRWNKIDYFHWKSENEDIELSESWIIFFIVVSVVVRCISICFYFFRLNQNYCFSWAGRDQSLCLFFAFDPWKRWKIEIYPANGILLARAVRISDSIWYRIEQTKIQANGKERDGIMETTKKKEIKILLYPKVKAMQWKW